MKAFAISACLALVGHSLAAPQADANGKALCGQWDQTETATYMVYQNLWNENAGPGKQCTTVDGMAAASISGAPSIKWNTAWSWNGGQGQVKSYANVGLKMQPKTLSSIRSIPSAWSWSYSGQNIVADVAYDLFTASTPAGDSQFEIMIWLGALGGAGPISANGQPIANPNVDGHEWKLYKGKNGQMTVFSFVANGPSVQSFNGDLAAFIKYLMQSQGMSGNQFLKSIAAGTEPFSGSNAVFTTSAYSVSLQ
ncbi:glycoside hydrolase family 12 protein [Aulographum hederae CBS 113979]|uniref:Glycoside hydrolase family 12 protein n=1 Tax=Aulographum hederae CBS 113979 TaxID=1176131 RepID=A0A6G1GIU4_9PEZI|nr:glycoside hydrolase family 12 protein [Aulographum hederae CBS 113979]